MAQEKYTYKIGIGITEHNRPEVFRECMKQLKKFMPPGAKLVIVDDASEQPVKDATYRFEDNVGIARAKNKCLELLSDCEHIFLFDSDCWPKAKNWWAPYIESPEPHLCYIFKDFVGRTLGDCIELYQDSGLVAYSHARGCMLYFDNVCMDTVGGMDTKYRRWGYEHVDLSNRIYNAGLTSFRYQDVVGSNELIFSSDEHESVKSTVSYEERAPYIREMEPYFRQSFSSTAYCPYIDTVDRTARKKDIVLTCYFTGVNDPQRGTQWEPNLDDLSALIHSVTGNGQTLVVLHDVPAWDVIGVKSIGVEMVKVETALNPYFQRWLSYYQYLRDHPEVGKVFCVDGTDVEMLKNPFDSLVAGKLYVGEEQIQLFNTWMIQHHRVKFLADFFRAQGRQRLLNAGVIGGTREDMYSFLHEMNRVYFDEKKNVGEFDMGIFNFVLRTVFNYKVVNGPQITTRFKGYETNNTTAWWKHK